MMSTKVILSGNVVMKYVSTKQQQISLGRAYTAMSSNYV